jgi:RNase P/RNase MRP subunit POP5
LTEKKQKPKKKLPKSPSASQKPSGKAGKRKLPKKSQRPKRRYILFKLEGCENAKKAFDLVMESFSMPERKAFGLWFIEFRPETKLGIARCRLGSLQKAREGLESVKGLKTIKTSGTLKALRGK